ncbi:MAG: YlmC/YmxH family sporulation protein [Clostridia bacterium]|nr:YlmC/YmxH family sporulation protein [Clostridia bacterium]
MICCHVEGLGDREVVNIQNGAYLGAVTDVQFEICDGRIVSFVVGDCRALGFSRNERLVIPFEKIVKFGEDVILVDIDPQACRCPKGEPPEKRPRGLFPHP